MYVLVNFVTSLNRNKIISICVILFSFVDSIAQAPVIYWQKSFGGTSFDDFRSIYQTNDGGFILAGNSESNDGDLVSNYGETDYWVVKLDDLGNIEWQKNYGGSDYDAVQSISPTSDNGYFITGYSFSDDGDISGHHGTTDYADFWILKTDTAGNIQWKKILGGTNSDFPYSSQQTNDGGYILTGNSYSNDGDITGSYGDSDYWVVKLDNTGSIVWQKSFGGSDDDQASSINQTADGGYLIRGETESIDGDITQNNGLYDYWLVKIDSQGEMEWQKTYGGTGDETTRSVQQTIDGGYILVGYSNSNDGDITDHNGSPDSTDFWVTKLNGLGEIQWKKSLGGTSTDLTSYVQEIVSEGYIVAGHSRSVDGDVTGNNGNYDFWIVKLDFDGNSIWQKSYGGSANDEFRSMQQTVDGGFVIAVYSLSNDGDVAGNHGGADYWIVKLNNLGIIEWQKSLGGTNTDAISSIQETYDGGYIVSGNSFSVDGDITVNHGNNDFWVVKLCNASRSCSSTGIDSEDGKGNSISIFPNPTNGRFSVELKWNEITCVRLELTNILGDIVYSYSEQITAPVVTKNFNLQLTQGMYYFTVISGINEQSERRIVQKINIIE